MSESDKPAVEPSAEPSQLAIDLARELYDRFVMGGWEPQNAWTLIDAMIAASHDKVEPNAAPTCKHCEVLESPCIKHTEAAKSAEPLSAREFLEEK
jgi:ATP-dependent helicase YprA (DUF1998 family)